ncbi:hypothetical protein KSC_059930 [Ktedonobacter sp. SOSP1-52]|uniref:mucoidy inhibitor MuiA family protein n=1 Tax=Ktedonobacter sp. SOSP1-52 TaxID=2778366 RepID=UPI00191620A6|nr:mucoidy inhibitor MuiA family protein [Ktedonobacter sp. SOSP1-52]GHO67101.1 hypothetical protein KSC_059930 [Ktedonobacter sp. SOSP1-52]
MPATDIQAPITEVTVYNDRALVTRAGTIHLAQGEHDVRINDLPPFLRESLRASGQGPQGMRILNVDITTAYHSFTTRDDLLKLEVEIEHLEQQAKLLKARQEALQDRRKWLRSLGEQATDFARGLARGQMKPQDCADFFRFAAQQAQQDAEESLELDVQVQRLQKEIHARRREYTQKQNTGTTDRLAAVVALEMPQEGDITLEISYMIMGASWQPQYDVRVQLNEDGNRGEVELTYLGVVTQRTDEDWSNVQLSLSTARPSLASVLPELKPWYINTFTPAPVYARTLKSQAMPAAGMSAHMEDMDMPPPAAAAAPAAAMPQPAQMATASVENTGTAYVFRVARSVDIPSNGSPHKTTIALDRLPCTFDYVSAPSLEENVHLRATITNTTERVILPGTTHIFLKGEYVGTSQVKQTAHSERFKIFLGIDDSIKVERKLTERAVDKGVLLQNDLRRLTYGYRITISNFTSFPRQIVLRDHLPVPQHERVKIKTLHVQPAPTEQTKLSLYTWQFTLPPSGEYKVEYRFLVEHPRDYTLIGLPPIDEPV